MYLWMALISVKLKIVYDLFAVVNMVLGSTTLGAVASTLGRFLHAEVRK